MSQESKGENLGLILFAFNKKFKGSDRLKLISAQNFCNIKVIQKHGPLKFKAHHDYADKKWRPVVIRLITVNS